MLGLKRVNVKAGSSLLLARTKSFNAAVESSEANKNGNPSAKL
jgi:hypothetical protein